MITPRTDTFHNVFHFVRLETVGKGDEGDGVVFEAIGVTASGAGEMDVVEVVAVFATADAILEDARAIVNFMEKLVLGEEFEGTENAGAVHVGEPFLDIGKGEGFGTVLDGSIDEDADSGGTDAVML